MRANSVPGDSGKTAIKPRGSHPWTVCASGLLLLLQAAGYVALSIYLLLPLDWYSDILSPRDIDALSITIILIPAAVLAVLSAIGFLFLLRAGWLLAMAIQGATLLGCLALFFGTKPQAIFPVMVFCIVMAFYLNSSEVHVAFNGGKASHGP